MCFVDVGFCLHPGGNVGDHPTYQNYYCNSSSTSLTVKQVMSDVNFVYFNSQHLFSQYLTKYFQYRQRLEVKTRLGLQCQTPALSKV